MVTRDSAWPAGTPCWIDLGVDSVDRAIAFYEALFGWRIEPGPPEAGGYAMCTKDGKNVAGLGPKQAPDQPSVWVTYLATADVDETVSKIRAAGGQLPVEPMDVMDAGRLAVATDTGGAVFGVWQAGRHIGMELANEPGAVVWNENLSRDLDGNRAFYGAVFGYEYADVPGAGFRYATFSVDGNIAGGIGELPADAPPEMPAQWKTYFAVPATDDAVAKVAELGGSVITPAMNTPYGRMATVADDQGAVFAIGSEEGISES